MSSEKETVRCHQYTTGRGGAGYGFVDFSRNEDESQSATYQFSLSKGIGLRFSQLSGDAVLEVEPASSDFSHMAAFMTRSREEGGSISLYTHVLMTDTPDVRKALGLLKESNFLAPEQFTEVTRGKKVLRAEEKDCTLPSATQKELPPNQKERLGQFLARYWSLLEMREWGGRDRPEVALLLPGKSKEEMVRFFANEIVARLPEYVRPAVSASFGTTWDNRGVTPCVCCVISETTPNTYPYYKMDYPEEQNDDSRVPLGITDEEKTIGEMLLEKKENAYPETYCNIQSKAGSDDRFKAMARCFSAMAYCVSADLELKKQNTDPTPKLRKVYDVLVQLAEKRFGISEQEMKPILFPITKNILKKIKELGKTEEIGWVLDKDIELSGAGLEKEKIREADGLTRDLIRLLGNKKDRIQKLWDLSLRRVTDSETERDAQKELRPVSRDIIQNAAEPGEPIDASELQIIARVRCRMGLAGMDKEQEYSEASDLLVQNMRKWQETGFGTGLANDKKQESEKEEKYNNEHFRELVEAWLKEPDERSKPEFEKILWDVYSLPESLDQIRFKLKPQEDDEGCFRVLEKAEERLSELYRNEIQQGAASERLVESALYQCIRLCKIKNEGAKKLYDGYLETLNGMEDRTVLLSSIQKMENEKKLDGSEKLVAELIKDLGSSLHSNESEITGFLLAVERIQRKNPQEAETIIRDSYRNVIRQAAEAGRMSADGKKTVSKFILSQKTDKDTIQDSFDFAINNSSKDDTGLLNELAGKAVSRSEAFRESEFRMNLLEKAEEAYQKGLISEELDGAIREVLECEQNRLPEAETSLKLEHCKEIREKRLDEALREFFDQNSDVRPGVMEKHWNKDYAERYSCPWQNLEKDRIRPFAEESIELEYQKAGNKIAFLTTLWEETGDQSDTSVSATYRSVLESVLTDKYDELWRKAKDAEDPEKERRHLDEMADKCLGDNPEKIAGTTAWKARSFLKRFHELSREKADKNPAEAGELLKQIKREKGFGHSIRLDCNAMDPSGKGDIFHLFMMLASELTLLQETENGYWNRILQEYSFDKSLNPWHGQGPRMVNILAFLTKCMERMNAPEFAADLRTFLGEEYMSLLRNEKINRELFAEHEKDVLSDSLVKWISE